MMEKSYKVKPPKIKQSEHILALKLKTEGNSLGTLKTIIVILLIALQAAILALSYLFFAAVFQWYFTFSIILTLITCIYILSSDYHGQAKATWILFLLLSFGFGSVIYFLSDKRISFAKSRKKYTKIFNETKEYKKQNCDTKNLNKDIQCVECNE